MNGIGNATELALQLGTMAREAVREAAPKIEIPEPLPEAWRPFMGLYTATHFGTVLRLEWLEGKRGKDGRVVSLFFRIAKLRRLEPVATD